MSATEIIERTKRGTREVLDTRGLLCPYPFIKAKEALHAARPGTSIEILTDSEATAISSIPILCERSGYRLTTLRDGDNWRLLVEKP